MLSIARIQWIRALVRKHPALEFLANFIYSRSTRLIHRPFQRKTISKYFGENSCIKVILGAGGHIRDGWLSTDYMPQDFKIAFVDATKTLPFEDCSVDYIYSEHMIEHLTYDEGLFMLAQTYRVLKCGGRIRIATPGLDKIINLKNQNLSQEQADYITWSNRKFFPTHFNNRPCFVINCIFNDWGHKFIYDVDTMSDLLERVGFGDIMCKEVGESDDSMFRGMEHHGLIVGEKLNEVETMVLEAVKPL